MRNYANVCRSRTTGDTSQPAIQPTVSGSYGSHVTKNGSHEDWLALSSAVLAEILTEAAGVAPPIWCQKVTWLGYAEKRYDRVKARLIGILRESAYAKSEGEVPNGWTVDGNRIIVWEPRDAFGRRGFDWEDVPSTLIDEDASSGNRTVLNRTSLEEFLGRRLGPVRSWWRFWT